MKNPTNTIATKCEVTITPSAIKQVKQLCIDQNIPIDEPNLGLRIGVKGGGCSGFSYEIGFDDFKEGDNVFEMEGLRIFIQRTHATYLTGIEVDWTNGLDNRGFVFNNPNATSTCGCGSSFSA